MRVLQINSVCGYGSTGRIATDIHAELIRNGHESYIAYGRGEAMNIDEKFTIKIANKLDNYIDVFRTRVFDQHGLGLKRITKNFIKKIEELNPDVIHLHNIHGYYLNYPILFDYLKKSNKKIIWTLHDCWTFTGHCFHYYYIDCQKWKIECYSCPQLKRYPASILLDNSKNNFRIKKSSFTGLKDLTIVTPSKWLAEEVKKSFLKEYRIEVINNGIDINIFKPTTSDFRKKYNLENKKIILGVASKWEERKGLDYFFQISKLLNENERIVLVGLDKKQMKNLPKNILGIERTNNTKELAEIYTAADVFFNPTLEEVQGLTNLEALFCNTYGITFNSGGSPECYTENNGKIVIERKPEIILKIIRESYGKKIEIDREKFSKENMIKGYMEQYKI